jgi:hypothetical protein
VPVRSTEIPPAVTERRTSSSRSGPYSSGAASRALPGAGPLRLRTERTRSASSRGKKGAQHVVGAGLEREDAIHVGARAREHQHRHVLRLGRLADRAAHGEAGLVAEQGIDHDRTRRLAAQHLAGFRRRARLEQLEAAAFERATDLLPARRIGIDDQNSHHGVRHSIARLQICEAMM